MREPLRLIKSRDYGKIFESKEFVEYVFFRNYNHVVLSIVTGAGLKAGE
jgi:hypothetical protein